MLFGVRDKRFLSEDVVYELVYVRPKKFQKNKFQAVVMVTLRLS